MHFNKIIPPNNLVLYFYHFHLSLYLDFVTDNIVHSNGDQSWVFFGRNDTKAETPVLWSPHAKSWPIGKVSDAGRNWGQEEKGTTEDEMAGWHHQLNGHESEWTPGVGDGQGGLACCDSWGRKESDTTEWLNWMIKCDFTLMYFFLFRVFQQIAFSLSQLKYGYIMPS